MAEIARLRSKRRATVAAASRRASRVWSTATLEESESVGIGLIV
jgi:hypothetical protein